MGNNAKPNKPLSQFTVREVFGTKVLTSTDPVFLNFIRRAVKQVQEGKK